VSTGAGSSGWRLDMACPLFVHVGDAIAARGAWQGGDFGRLAHHGDVGVGDTVGRPGGEAEDRVRTVAGVARYGGEVAAHGAEAVHGEVHGGLGGAVAGVSVGEQGFPLPPVAGFRIGVLW